MALKEACTSIVKVAGKSTGNTEIIYSMNRLKNQLIITENCAKL